MYWKLLVCLRHCMKNYYKIVNMWCSTLYHKCLTSIAATTTMTTTTTTTATTKVIREGK